jgi:hypothetical protein
MPPAAVYLLLLGTLLIRVIGLSEINFCAAQFTREQMAFEAQLPRQRMK